jgi:hypothetical protein
MDDLPVIHEKLQRLRWAAKALATAGFDEQAIEMMRISRGEVKILSKQVLFGMSRMDIDNARLCVNSERKRWAASYVLSRKAIESEDEIIGPQGWPKGRKKSAMIEEAVGVFNVPVTSLEKYMGGADCPNEPENGVEGLSSHYIHPDWHPDKEKELFVRCDNTGHLYHS